MKNKKTIIVFQEINGKTIKKTFEYKKLEFRNDYIIITTENGKKQGFKNFKNFIADVDNFGDLE